MAIIVQYSKKSVTTGHDSLILYALDAFCQEIIKVIIFRTHPFAQQIVKILYPGHDNILNLWNNYLFVNKDRLFTTEDLSGILETISLKIMGIPVGVREYRHIQVFIRWTYCLTMWSSLGLRDENNTAALQAGHQLETEEQLYGVSGGYLGQIPECLVEPYIWASTKWQVFMQVPKGGKNIDIYHFSQKLLQDTFQLQEIDLEPQSTSIAAPCKPKNNGHPHMKCQREYMSRFIFVEPGRVVKRGRASEKENILQFCMKF